MKKKVFVVLTFLAVSLLFLTACGIKKEDLQGKWKAQDAQGNDVTIDFKKDKIKLDGDSISYKVNGKGNENGNRYITFTSGGEYFTAFFPEKDNKTALLLKTDGEDDLKGEVYFAMSKSEQPDYDKYVKKYMNDVHYK
ncbi:hypothetical protein ACVR0S_02155 [Streptococcus dentapri]|uniref:Lipoprotein n=1 Tax=Streptococcus dentapri TaxID=573564 RepID=A0ABV8CYX9_9STRE